MVLITENDHSDESEEAVTTNKKDALVDFLVREIRDEFQSNLHRSRDDLFFYDVVRGGNVQVIDIVVTSLKELRCHDELDWIMGIKSNKDRTTNYIPSVTKVGHVFMCLIYSVISVLLTPVFYIVHTILYHIRDNMKTQLIRNLDLMFLHSVVSLQPEMIKLFMKCGCDLSDTDERGNNIFHYLAAMSVEQPKQAIQCHRILCSCLDMKMISVAHTVLTEQRNVTGSTALEDVAKYGSLIYLKYLLEQDGCIGQLVVRVGSSDIWLNDKRAMLFSVHTPAGSTQGVNLAGLHMAQEMNSISDPNTSGPTMLDPATIGVVLPGAMDDKRGTVIFDVHTSVGSFVDVSMAGVPGIAPDIDTELPDADDALDPTLSKWEVDFSQYDRGDAVGRNSYLLQLIASYQVEKLSLEDVSYLFESKLLKKWLSSKISVYTPFIVMGNLMCLAVTVLILADVVLHGGDRNTRPLVLIMASNLTTYLQEHSDTSSIRPESTEIMRAILNIGLNNSQEEIMKECNGPEDLNEITEQSNELLVQITNYLNVTTREFRPKVRLDSNIYLGMAIITILLWQAVLDLWFRWAFLWSNYGWKNASVCRGIIPVIERWLPGSYVDKQLMALIYSMFAVIVILIWTTENQLYITPAYPEDTNKQFTWFIESIQEFQKAINESASMEQIISNMYVMCLLLSFLHTTHILRLFPGINFFIITTKKMSKHLLEFAAILLIVFFVFSSVFAMVMRDSGCPMDKMVGFESTASSLFSTYSTILGHRIPDFSQSARSKIAYVSCTIVIIIIMLNLIIALMTMTATEMRARPWKMVMCRMELWDEILGTEARVLMLWQPVKSLVAAIRRRCCSHRETRHELILKVVHFE